MNTHRSATSPALRVALAVTALFLAGCGDSLPTMPPMAAARSGSDLSVTSTDPNKAHQDTTLDVRVVGSGFDQGSRAEWAIAGVPTAKVRTNSTRFVNSKELVANITIALDADPVLYDVQVITSRGKKGIGTELFQVQPIPAIAFVQGTALMVMSSDGSRQTVVLDAGETSYRPSWSPDGTQLVFGSSIQGRGVYVINLDGTGLRKVVATTGGYENPAWSPVPAPDGRFKIAYLDLPGPPDGTIEGGNQDLFLVNPDGTGRVNVTNTRELHERYPTWSPSATRVAAFVEKYTVAEPGVPVGLFVYDLGLAGDGGVTITGQTNLTASGPLSTAYLVIRPDWARTQDRIAVVVLETGSSRWDIWRIDLADPTNPVNITRTPTVGEHMPSWSPDDSRIAYQRNNSKNRLSIFVMNADGSSATDIGQPARGLAGQSYPSWRRGSE